MQTGMRVCRLLMEAHARSKTKFMARSEPLGDVSRSGRRRRMSSEARCHICRRRFSRGRKVADGIGASGRRGGAAAHATTARASHCRVASFSRRLHRTAGSQLGSIEAGQRIGMLHLLRCTDDGRECIERSSRAARRWPYKVDLIWGRRVALS